MLSHGTCDDAGACGSETMTDCMPYACATTGCKPRCAGDGDCAPGFFCWQARAGYKVHPGADRGTGRR